MLSVEDMKAQNDEGPQQPFKNDLQNFFERWQHGMQLCVHSNGNYFEENQIRFSEHVQ